MTNESLIFSDHTSREQKKRFSKLIIIFTIPVFMVFVQCGMLVSRSSQTKFFITKQNQGIAASLEIGALLKELQKERDFTSFLLTQKSPFSYENLLAAQKETDATINQMAFWKGEATDNEFGTKLMFRQFLNGYRELVSGKSQTPTSSALCSLLWYTDVISKLLKWVYHGVILATATHYGSDELWKYFTSFELLLACKDKTDLHRTLGTMFFTKGFLATEELKLFIESDHEAVLLRNLSLQHSDELSQLYDSVLVPKYTDALTDVTRLRLIITEVNATAKTFSSTTDSGLKANSLDQKAWSACMNVYMTEIITRMETVLINSISWQTTLQLQGAQNEFNAALTVLVFIIASSPLLCMWYIKSVTNMVSLITVYGKRVMLQNAEIQREVKRSNQLLHRFLPPSIVDEVRHNREVLAETYQSVTVCFASVMDFGELIHCLSPTDVVEFLNSVHAEFGAVINAFDVYKVETSSKGDLDMIVSGVPVRNGDKHAGEIATLAISLRELTMDFKIIHLHTKQILLRIGMHTGPCVAGVVGQKLPRFCLFGETVDIAAKMETSGLPLRIHVSDDSKRVLDSLGGYSCAIRGSNSIENGSIYKTTTQTWWLIGKISSLTDDQEPKKHAGKRFSLNLT